MKPEPTPAPVKHQRSEKRSQVRGEKNAHPKGVVSVKISKTSRPAKLGTFPSKTGDKNTSHSKISFPPNTATFNIRSKNGERKRNSKGSNLSKAKSCGDLLEEQAKESVCETRIRRNSESENQVEEDKTLAPGLPLPLPQEKPSSIPGDSYFSQNGTEVTDLSELSAELNAALAKPTPEPVKLNLSRNYLLDDDNATSFNRTQALEKDRGRFVFLYPTLN